MARIVTAGDIQKINELYLELKTYAAVARTTGFATSTIKKYVIPGYIPASKINKKNFDEMDISRTNYKFPADSAFGWSELMTMTDEDVEGIEDLRKEILI